MSILSNGHILNLMMRNSDILDLIMIRNIHSHHFFHFFVNMLMLIFCIYWTILSRYVGVFFCMGYVMGVMVVDFFVSYFVVVVMMV